MPPEALKELLGDEEFLKEIDDRITAGIQGVLKEVGFDRVDRKYTVFPGIAEDPEKSDREKAAKLIRAVVRIKTGGLEDQDREVLAGTRQTDSGMYIFPDGFRRMVIAYMRGRLAQELQAIHMRAMSVGTATAGGYLVPDAFELDVIKALAEFDSIRNYVKVVNVAGSVKGDWPTSSTVTCYWPGENTAITESTPTIGRVQWDCNELSGLSKLSAKLFRNEQVDLIGLIVELFGDAFRAEENKKFISGTGSSQPKGIEQETLSNSTAQSGATLAYSDLTALFTSLDERYRMNAHWFMNDTVYAGILDLEDNQGRPIFSQRMDAPPPKMLLGRPIHINNNLSGGSGTTEAEIYFGDPRYYALFDENILAVAISSEAGDDTGGAFSSNQIWVRVIESIDGKMLLTGAWAELTGVLVS